MYPQHSVAKVNQLPSLLFHFGIHDSSVALQVSNFRRYYLDSQTAGEYAEQRVCFEECRRKEVGKGSNGAHFEYSKKNPKNFREMRIFTFNLYYRRTETNPRTH